MNENVAPANQGPQTSSPLATDLFSKTLSVARILLVTSENLGPDIVTPWRWDMPLSASVRICRILRALGTQHLSSKTVPSIGFASMMRDANLPSRLKKESISRKKETTYAFVA
ncbi:hypothetical protein [Rhizobium leguminosarum]|uniref:hypothetical protein n=1 Tax=Rhizobium leguminosarum TaxID=384 RepID=UPI003D077A8C